MKGSNFLLRTVFFPAPPPFDFFSCMSRSSVCALLAFTLAFAAPARAQTTAVIAPDRPLTLEDAIALAMQKNFNLRIQGNTLERSRESLESAKAIFDPNLGASAGHTFSRSAGTTTQLESTSSEGDSFQVNASQLLPWTNGTLSLSAPLSRSASDNSFNTLRESYSFGLNADFTQSLTRGGPAAARINIDRAKISLSIANINYRSQVLNVIASVENAYFNLVTARETVRIQQSSLALAQRAFDESSTRRTAGLLTDIDVLTSEVSVASARRALVLADQAVRTAEENLLNLINVPEFDTRPGPVRFEDYTEGVPNLAMSYKTARERYPQTLSATESLKQLQLDLENARRNARPAVNLNATLGFPARPTPDGYTEVISNLPSDHGKNWSVRVTYSMPWGRRAAKSQVRQVGLEIESQKLNLEQLEQQLILQVRQAVRAIETNIAAVELATKQTQLAERQYDQQKARFDSGLTTSRQVQQFQDDLEAARFDELSSKLALRRAVTSLRQLDGTSIERYRIQLP
jgi:outer membrane protein